MVCTRVRHPPFWTADFTGPKIFSSAVKNELTWLVFILCEQPTQEARWKCHLSYHNTQNNMVPITPPVSWTSPLHIFSGFSPLSNLRPTYHSWFNLVLDVALECRWYSDVCWVSLLMEIGVFNCIEATGKRAERDDSVVFCSCSIKWLGKGIIEILC